MYRQDYDAFIFSLINRDGNPVKMNCINHRLAIYGGKYGPSFGFCDIVISSYSNKNIDSYANLGISYSHPKYWFYSTKAQTFLANSKHFKVREIEVFQTV